MATGRLLSVDVGRPRVIEWDGKTVRTAIWKEPVEGPRMVRRINIDGDDQADRLAHGGEHRAVFVDPIESYRYWERQLGGTTSSMAYDQWTVDELFDHARPVSADPRTRARSARSDDAGMKLRTRLPAVVLMSVAALCWGLSSATSKVALEQLGPIDLLAIEIGAGAAVLIPIAAVRAPRVRRAQPAYLLLGVLEPGLSFLLFDLGLSRTSATHAALLLSSETLFVVVLARLWLRERLSPALAVAVGAGFGGAMLVALEPGGPAGSVLGDSLVLGASALAAGYGVLARKVAPTGDWLTVTATQLAAALVICLPIFTLSSVTGHSQLASADVGHLLAAVATGALASVIPFASTTPPSLAWPPPPRQRSFR